MTETTTDVLVPVPTTAVETDTEAAQAEAAKTEAAGSEPTGTGAVRAGATPLGRIRDFSPVARQEISEFTSDSGNHVHMELVRTEGDLIP